MTPPTRRARRAHAPSSRIGPRYLRIRLRVPAALEDDAAAACREAGSLGVSVDATAGRVGRASGLSAWFPSGQPAAAVRRRLLGALRDIGWHAHPAGLRAESINGSDWVEAWRRSLRPMRIGRRLLIVPERCRVPAPRGRLPIRVRLGQAFGTGEHPTTRLCLRLAEKHLRPGDRVLDLGTGSGILAIAALRLGAARVDAVDDDPVALRVARANLRDNDLRGRINLRRCDARRACRRRRFDVVVMNIGITTIERVLPGVAGALPPGGLAILAGMLVADERAVLDAASPLRLRLRSRLRSHPWSALVLEREPR